MSVEHSIPTKKRLHIVSGQVDEMFAEAVVRSIDQPLDEVDMTHFAGEHHVRFNDSVRGADLFIIQSHGRSREGSVNDSMMQQTMMIDAAKRASAKRITAVCPYLGYSGQDKKMEGREPIGAAAVVSMLINAGADLVMSVDLHSGQIQGFGDVPIVNLTALPLMAREFQDVTESSSDGLIVVAPDTGRTKIAETMSSILEADLGIVYRPDLLGTKTSRRGVVGDIVGKHCLIIDDKIDTGLNATAAAEVLVDEGALIVDAMASHGVFSEEAVKRIQDSPLNKVFVTDSLPVYDALEQLGHQQLHVVTVAGLVGDAIMRVFEDKSVSELFSGHNYA